MSEVGTEEIHLGCEVVDRADLASDDPDFCAHDYDFGNGCPECGNTTVLVEVEVNG